MWKYCVTQINNVPSRILECTKLNLEIHLHVYLFCVNLHFMIKEIAFTMCRCKCGYGSIVIEIDMTSTYYNKPKANKTRVLLRRIDKIWLSPKGEAIHEEGLGGSFIKILGKLAESDHC